MYLIHASRTVFPCNSISSSNNPHSNDIEWLDEIDQPGNKELWFSVIACICAAANNPQNGQ